MGLKAFLRRILPKPVRHVLGNTFYQIRLRLTIDHSPYPLPWFRSYAQPEPIDRVHRLALHLERAGQKKTAALMLRAALWPLASLILAAMEIGKHGALVKKNYAISLSRQLRQMLIIANRYNTAPKYYYEFRPFLRGELGNARYYIQHYEQMHLCGKLAEKADAGILNDKLRFYEHCTKHSLNTAPIIALFGGGKVLKWMDGVQGALPAMDLFLKPTDSCHGTGAERWTYDTATRDWHRHGIRLGQEGVVEHCCELSKTRPIILQPRLYNHPKWMPYTSGALATTRVVTCRFPNESPRFLTARLGIPTGDMIVDHHDNSLGAGIPFEDGVLTPAVAKDIGAGDWDCHPDTGGRIAGEALHGFPEMLALCLRAHETLPDLSSVGWDVTMTPQGPVLVEGNLLWGHTSAQAFQQRPLGKTPYAEFVLAHLGDLSA